MSNKEEVTDITQLPIKNIKYGPLQFELEQVKVIIGPIVCQPSENNFSIKEQMVKNQIEELKNFDGVIENKTEILKAKMTENFEFILNQTEDLKDFDKVIRNETEDLTTIVTENSENIKKNALKSVTENLKTKITENSEKIKKNALKSVTENLKTEITENSERIQLLENRCPLEISGYFEMRGKCYFTDTITRNFDNSQAHCKEVFPLGGQLFEPRDDTTNKEVMKNRYKGATWIGITDRSSQGIYRYESDNGQLTVSQWYSGEPNGADQHCVVIINSNGDWYDTECSGSLYSLCERTY